MNSNKRRGIRERGDMDTSTIAGVRAALGHAGVGYTEIRLLKGKDVRSYSISGKETSEQRTGIAQAINVLNKEGYNVYVGANPRAFEGVCGAKGIKYMTTIVLDGDGIRDSQHPSSEFPATNKEAEIAQRAGSELSNSLDFNTRVLFTSNGIQIWIPLAVPVDVRGRREIVTEATKMFVASLGLPEGAKWDDVFDLPRLVRMPESFCWKERTTDDRPNRRAGKLILTTKSNRVTAHSILMSNLDYLDVVKPKADPVPWTDEVPDRFEKLLKSDVRLQETYFGSRTDLKDSSGSGFDMSLANLLRSRRFTPEETYAIMKSSPSGKKNWREDYAKRTIEKVYNLR